MKRSYNNRWIPSGALKLLKEHSGSILDVGGGAAPYADATHILDMQAFSEEGLKANAWPAEERARGWTQTDYTQLDIVAEREWPFETDRFDLGLSSHCLEDLRDPIPAVREMARVCRKVLIITPSRLLEQTRGIEHPLFCGFPHHPWIVFSVENRLIFRRKTSLLMLPQAHLTCPIGKTLGIDDGSTFFYGDSVEPEEQMFWSEQEDLEDYARFIEPYRKRRDLFVDDGKRHTVPYWAWKLRQKYLGCL